MKVELITQPDALASLAQAWDALAGGVPFRGFAWNSSWWRHYGDGAELFVLAVRDGEQLVGLAPWYRESEPLRGRVLRFLGSGEVCSDYLGILCETGREHEVADSLAHWMGQAGASSCGASAGGTGWDCLELVGVDEQEPVVRLLAESLRRRGAAVDTRPGMNCWRLEFDGDFEAYVSTLSKSHRKQVRRILERQLETGRAVMHTVRDRNELERGMQIFVELHQKRRKSLGEPGCFSSPRFSAFHHEVAARLLEAGQLRLHWIELEGRAVAVEYHLQGGGVVYAYQSGLDPDALDEEPGRIASVYTLKAAIDDGLTAFDFLRGDEPYKAHWRAQPRPTIEWRIAAPGRVARMRHGAYLAAGRFRRWLKQRLHRDMEPATKGHPNL